MIFSIIVNTHNQYKTINRCIKSCLTQNFKKKYEIIIIDTSKKKFKNKILKSKKIQYFHYKSFSVYPEINQLKKVHLGCKKAKGRWICLMDGDDFFEKNKLKYIYDNYNLYKKMIIQDTSINYLELSKKKSFIKIKNYKKNLFYNLTFSFWPTIHGTSSLSGNTKLIKSFFKSIHLTKWKFLAIDALLTLYALNKKAFLNDKNILTVKSIGSNNLGRKYTFFIKNYWFRRYQQIKYWETVSKKKIYNLDKFITFIIYFFIK